MAQTKNYIWSQGSDLAIRLNYKEGADVASATIVDLTSGYAVRMDLVVPVTNERVYTFNSATIPDVDPIAIGSQADTTLESTLSNGADGMGNIQIFIPRALTLPGGIIYTKMTDIAPVTVFNYDLFLRNTATNKQDKILKGSVTIESSSTLWL